MYAACISCSANLGANAVIAAFPVGVRLAFDQAQGRLWVVCRACGRWNLTPLEERWEAIEECEREFANVRVRASTDNIALARHPDGVELVRVGRPGAYELAAWRYSDRLARRRWQAMAAAAASVAALAATGYGLAALGAGGAGGVVLGALGIAGSRRVIARVPTESGPFLVRPLHLARAAWVPALGGAPLSVAIRARGFGTGELHTVAEASGDQAMTLLGRALARLNRHAGSPAQIAGAVQVLESLGDPLHEVAFAEAYGRDVMLRALPRIFAPHHERVLRDWQRAGRRMTLALLPAESRLALEMAVSEDLERRALEGELAGLEHAWREAEEIAAIADALLVPTLVMERVRALRDLRST